MSQWKGKGAPVVGSEAEQQVQEQRTAAVRVLGRLGGYKTPLEQPRQARCQANSSGDSGWPATARQGLQARQLTTSDAARSRRTAEAIKTGRGGWLPPRTSVAFATRWKQNVVRRSDRLTANTLGLQTMEQSRE